MNTNRFNSFQIVRLLTRAALLIAFAATCAAQQATTVPAPTPWAITSRAANSRIWERTTYELSPSGQVVPHLHHYTELATGLCYQKDGEWTDSQELVNILPDGTASATNGQHQAYFPIDIYNGTITLITPDGLELSSQPVGLFYDDGTNTVMIASLTNSIGQLVADNQVIYTNAFAGIDADLLYTYTKAGFEQDVILERQLPSPEAYGLYPETTKLQLVTEFFNPPQPTITATTSAGPDGTTLTDESLDFGTMTMARGRAFLLGSDAAGAAVVKSWVTVDGRQFLVEETPVAALANQLSKLPPLQASAKAVAPYKLARSAERLFPHRRDLSRTRDERLSIRKSISRENGLVFDYDIVHGSPNYVFQGDTTYYISGTVNLGGTNIFEGGTVLKYTNALIDCGAVEMLSSQYRPVIFTSMDDNSVGENIDNSTGNPTNCYAASTLLLTGTNSLHDLRICYAAKAITADGALNLTNVQIVNCGAGIYNFPEDYNPFYLNLRNVLMANVNVDVSFNTFDGWGYASAQNVTFANPIFSTNYFLLANGSETFYGVSLTNCVLANVYHSSPADGSYLTGSYNGFYPGYIQFGSDAFYLSSSPFVTVGGGGYYLATNTLQGRGTTNIDTALLADLAPKTTQPPIVFSNEVFSVATNLGPQVARENTNAPDLGYAYDPLDYVFGGCDLESNATVSAGTAIGWFQGNGQGLSGDGPYSIALDDSAVWSLNGTATQPCCYVNYAMVQEGENGNWTNNGTIGSVVLNAYGSTPLAQISADFTKWIYCDAGGVLRDGGSGPGLSPASGAGYFENCEFYNLGMSSYNITSLTFTNCLFFRDDQNFWYSPNLSYVNCTFYDGCLSMYRTLPVLWSIENSAFDGTMFAWGDSYNGRTNYTTIDYNAYNTNNWSWTNYPYSFPPTNGIFETNGPNTVDVTNFNWETSWFGIFYQPTNSLTFHVGSTTANLLGLYWFTTQTNQTIEGTNQVTIGYHYVATDTNGNPLENLTPPVPNYLSDPSGSSNFLTILAWPMSETVTQGYNATFSVTAVGVPPPVYQWYLNGTALSVFGSSSATLSLYGVQPNQAGNYSVVVTNSAGSFANSATLTVVPSQYVLPANAYWNVTDISDPAQPVHVGELQEPFSELTYPTNFYGTPIPGLNTPWHTNTALSITNGFGTTEFGGVSNMGTVFEIGLNGEVGATLYTFTNLNGAYPCSQLAISGSMFYGYTNTLYGTTLGGGSNGYGTVFKLNADGGGFEDLYEFAGTNDGKFPRTGLLIDGNTLYGTTSNSIFKINTDGSGFTCLTNITNASQLILSLSGDTLYGTTTNEGSYGGLFSIGTAGTNLTWLYNFTNGVGGAFPMGGLEIFECSNAFWNGSTTGILFGTTYGGGAHSNGMVFSINSDGSSFTDLHDFQSNIDGQYPVGGLLLTNNQAPGFGESTAPYLFGTTSSGGASNDGTIFGISLDGSQFTNLYSLRGTNGANPEGKLVLLGQTLYGTTPAGGVGTSTNGAIFSVNTDGTGFTNLYDFSGSSDGGSPVTGLALPVVDERWSIWSLDTTFNLTGNMDVKYQIAIDDCYALFVNGNLVSETNGDGVAFWLPYSEMPYLHQGENDIRVVIAGNGDTNDYFAMVIEGFPALPYVLYGTTLNGGIYDDGSVFQLGYSNDAIILHNFANTPDGRYPVGDLLLFSNTLYGVTEQGGTNGSTEGTIFSISAAGTNYQILHSFTNNTDEGYEPMAGLTVSSNMLYGTTYYGGSNNNSEGTIFSISTSGSNYSVLHSFHDSGGNDGYHPQAPLLLIGTNLYGTTSGGGANNEGTAFSICTNGSGYSNLFSFGYGSGNNPMAGLVLVGTNLYGTTQGGGSNSFGGGQGTIFYFPLGGTTDIVLHTFSDAPDGKGPVAGLVLSGDTLYGTTQYGGSNSDGTTGDGTIFSIGIGGNGYATLLSFGSTNLGVNPVSDMIVLSNSLYGTTYYGGTNNNGNGMIFSISINGTNFSDLYNFMGQPDGRNPEGGLSSP